MVSAVFLHKREGRRFREERWLVVNVVSTCKYLSSGSRVNFDRTLHISCR